MRRGVRESLIGGFAASLMLAVGVPWSEGAEAAAPPEGDRPLRIIKQAEFRFPPRLLTIGITSGEVRLFLSVERDGTLADHLFVAFTHHEFANEVSLTLPRWRYEPAMVDGRPIASTIALKVRFEVNGMLVTERRGFEDPPAASAAFMFRARELNELDAVPRLVFSVVPPNPAAADEPAIAGRARVDFYIDEDGRVRMPVVAAADDERLGWAALAAIVKWQFEIPRRGGHPVLARASQVFVFAPDG